MDVKAAYIDAADAEYVEETIDEVYSICMKKRCMVSI